MDEEKDDLRHETAHLREITLVENPKGLVINLELHISNLKDTITIPLDKLQYWNFNDPIKYNLHGVEIILHAEKSVESRLNRLRDYVRSYRKSNEFNLNIN